VAATRGVRTYRPSGHEPGFVSICKTHLKFLLNF
jgi:hypothetical protein